jgi:hypothetical protein
MLDVDLPLDSTTDPMRTQLKLSIGIVAGALINGALLTLGIACFFLLSIEHQLRRPSQKKYLRIYIVILLLVNLGYETTFFIWNSVPSIFVSRSPEERREISNILVYVCKLTPTISIGLTDGLMVCTPFICKF